MKSKTKEESDLRDTMQLDGGGGASSQARERGMGAFVRSKFLFPSLEFLCGFLLLVFFFLIFSLNYPSTFLHLLGAGLVEESGYSLRKVPEVRGQSSAPGDLWARKDEGGSGRIRGGRFLWAAEGSNVTFLLILSPTSPQESPPHTICHHLPSIPSGVPGT